MNGICPVCNSPINPEDSACPVCGFKLAGSTQSFKPISFAEAEVTAAPEKPISAASVELRVIRGPQIGMSYTLNSDSLSIGRSPQCDIFLNDMTVSRLHATITRTNGIFTIEDANSFNGVWINNESIENASLKEGDIIQIGVFCLVYHENASS